ncbi:MAG TPA: adenylate/guanylate cyclase domain-containing protein [Actinospica sp.]|nr:adenylate/guanylate cyclase domain-containing protein [Actinospica sp.]
MQCPSCGHPLPAGARFCPSCGTAAESAEPTGSVEARKTVTVVFCDLVASTELSGMLDPETLRTVTLRFFTAMAGQIEAHDGTVEKFIGDAVMAVFGVPAVHEDDARRALAAALGMMSALDGLNTELAATLGIRLNIRIGVNTGQVVAGHDASARQALVSGETVNIAARLEQNAAPGEILIGPETFRAAGPTVHATALGPLRVKGRQDPVAAYRLHGLGADDPELLRRFDIGFVGRARELAALDDALSRVGTREAAGPLLVLGEAGLGKTRLIREWLRRAGNPLGYAVGRARPYGTHGSLQPLADALGPHLADCRAATSTAEALEILAAGVLRDGSPNAAPDEISSALATLLTALAGPRPFVLVIDDCHWAGPLLLGVLDRAASAARALIICLARPDLFEEQGPPASWRTLDLSALDQDECALLAEELTEVCLHARHAPDRLLERAEGNPLHLEQLLAAVDETGSAHELPPTVQALLGARIDRLAPAERLILDAASVIGREFLPAELAEVARCGADRVHAALPRLTARRLIEPSPAEPAFRFSTGLIHEVAYACMSKRARADQHERAAPLASVRAAGDSAAGRHFERAYTLRTELGILDPRTDTLRRRAARALTRAGAQALARSDLAWAHDLLTRATALAQPGESTGPAAARRLGEACLALGRTAEGLDLLRSVAADPAATRVEAAHARLDLAVAEPGPSGPVEAATAALPVFEAAHDELGQARACLRFAQDQQVNGRHAAAELLLTRTLAHADRADGEPERAAALGAIGVSLWRGPRPAAEAVERCRSLIAEHGPGRRTVRVTLNCPLAVLHALREDTEAARAALAEAAHHSEQLGYAEAQVFLPLFAAVVETLADRPEQALALLRDAARTGRRLGAHGLLGTIELDSIRLLLDLGRPAEAAELIAAAEPDRPRPLAESVELAGLRARAAGAAGDRESALRLIRFALQEAAPTDALIVQAQAELDHAHTLLLLGAPAEAGIAASAAGVRFAAKGHLPGVRWARRLAARAAREKGTTTS